MSAPAAMSSAASMTTAGRFSAMFAARAPSSSRACSMLWTVATAYNSQDEPQPPRTLGDPAPICTPVGLSRLL